MNGVKGVLFDLDQTLVNSRLVETLRDQGQWEEVYRKIPECSLYPGVSEIIKDLQSADWKIGIVTSSPRQYAEKIIQHFDLQCDTLKAFHDTKMNKPHPEPYIDALKEMNVKRAFAWAIGDKQDDIDAANTLGIVSIYARWGNFAPSGALISPDDICQKYDLCFDRPRELGKFLLQKQNQHLDRILLDRAVESDHGMKISGGPDRFYNASINTHLRSEWYQIDQKGDFIENIYNDFNEVDRLNTKPCEVLCPRCGDLHYGHCIVYLRPYHTSYKGQRFQQYYWAFVCLECKRAFELNEINDKDKKNLPVKKRKILDDILLIDKDGKKSFDEIFPNQEEEIESDCIFFSNDNDDMKF